jgi:hypothetical protein
LALWAAVAVVIYIATWAGYVQHWRWVVWLDGDVTAPVRAYAAARVTGGSAMRAPQLREGRGLPILL